MTEQEKFKKAFENVKASPDVLSEVLAMTTENNTIYMKRNNFISKVTAAALSAAMLFGTGTFAYANDIGGIQRIMQLWIHGDQTTATVTVSDGKYCIDYTDAEGNELHEFGGGVSFNNDGTESPATEEDLLKQINAPEVIYEEDGTVMFYYLDQKIDITNMFIDGVCYLQVKDSESLKYVTVKYQNGFAVSTHHYVQPEKFN